MFFAHEFDAEITNQIGDQRLGTCIVLPEEIAARLPFDTYTRLRVDAEIGGVDHQGAWVPYGGRYKMMLSRRLLARIGKGLGDRVRVSFNVADQDAMPLPRELVDALEDDMFCEAWEAMPIGQRRSWCYRIDKLKSQDARLRNVDKLTAELLG
ncbi:bacteriocin resistance YdeI/OmpD-like protein [Litoreibacter ponti]|uniref:Bacteriocin resistance YdeI/OmpD-like protein n=1 Tax=Litoreibacter ponti TaxID=1510457 RepID=A0A2T6BM51_9RHOB|nr:DUF1905 domain-containing protein [Litoreibacter ponti]PTX57067.1 bacteriocin resistance YdeI/OmpD-like protein [Litoreibacter ponti]